jgi:hypothetical protein
MTSKVGTIVLVSVFALPVVAAAPHVGPRLLPPGGG